MRKGNIYSLKERSVFLLVILNISKVTNFFNLIQMKLLLEAMLNLIKISWPTRLIRHLCLLRPMSHLQCLCHILFLCWFLLHQMMIVRIKIHLCLLTFIQMSPLKMNLNQHHYFIDGSIQHENHLVILLVIL
jgi:hypothetical protein